MPRPDIRSLGIIRKEKGFPRRRTVELEPLGEPVILKPDEPTADIDIGPVEENTMKLQVVTLPGLAKIGIHGCGGILHLLDFGHWQQAGHKPPCRTINETINTLTENYFLALNTDNTPGSEDAILSVARRGELLINLTLHQAADPCFPLTSGATVQPILAKFPPR